MPVMSQVRQELLAAVGTWLSLTGAVIDILCLRYTQNALRPQTTQEKSNRERAAGVA